MHEVLKAQPKWTYFMIWAGLAEMLNPMEKLREVFSGTNLLNRGDPRLAEAMDDRGRSESGAAYGACIG